MPGNSQVMRKAKIGVVEASTTVLAADTYCCAEVINKNGIVELMDCWKANSFQAADRSESGFRAREDDKEKDRGDQRADRDEGDRRDGAEADLGQRVGGAPAARQSQQQGIVAPAPRGLYRACCDRRRLRRDTGFDLGDVFRQLFVRQAIRRQSRAPARRR